MPCCATKVANSMFFRTGSVLMTNSWFLLHQRFYNKFMKNKMVTPKAFGSSRVMQHTTTR